MIIIVEMWNDDTTVNLYLKKKFKITRGRKCTLLLHI